MPIVGKGADFREKVVYTVAFLISILSYILVAMQIAIIARALYSWVDPTGRTPIGVFLRTVTDPIIAPIRRVLPSTGFVDFSPFVAIIIIVILQRLLGSIAVGR